jgi:hypothetical protein
MPARVNMKFLVVATDCDYSPAEYSRLCEHFSRLHCTSSLYYGMAMGLQALNLCSSSSFCKPLKHMTVTSVRLESQVFAFGPCCPAGLCPWTALAWSAECFTCCCCFMVVWVMTLANNGLILEMWDETSMWPSLLTHAGSVVGCSDLLGLMPQEQCFFTIVVPCLHASVSCNCW